jgi:hypothetical protein
MQHNTTASVVSVLQDEKVVKVRQLDKSLKLLNVSLSTVPAPYNCQLRCVVLLKLSADSSLLASAFLDGIVNLLDIKISAVLET